MGSSTFDFLRSGNLVEHWPTDWIVLGAIAALIALDALRSGSARAAALSIALPLTTLLTSLLPSAFLVGSFSAQTSPSVQAIIYNVLLVALFLFLHRIVYSFSDAGGVLTALFSGIAAAVVLAVTWLQVPLFDSLWHVGPSMQAVFGEAYRFWWLLVAYAGLAFVRS